jgi:hypothetical protein
MRDVTETPSPKWREGETASGLPLSPFVSVHTETTKNVVSR